MPAPRAAKPPTERNARERILAAAYELFSRNGTRAVGIDAVIERAGIARMTLYRHFNSKEDLVLAFLERREQQWTKAWLEAEVQKRATDPEERLLAIFDVFDQWFRSEEFEGCSFINVLLESADRASTLGQASASYLARIRSFVERLAAEAGIADAEDFARKWHILMKGSIIAAGEGDALAAQRGRQIGALLLRHATASQAPAGPASCHWDSRSRSSRERHDDEGGIEGENDHGA